MGIDSHRSATLETSSSGETGRVERLPAEFNYVAVFLTLDCNLNCHYCINDPEQTGDRNTAFRRGFKTALDPEAWIRGLSKLPFSPDLPITLQGGEPMLYWGGKGLGPLMEGLPHYFDLLTNFAVKPKHFVRELNGQQVKLQRPAPYPAIRVSYHPQEMERVWRGRGFEELVSRCLELADYGFNVSPVKAESDVGIYMVEHRENVVTDGMRRSYQGRVPFETKEFLGMDEGKLYGTYLYPFSTNLLAGGTYHRPLSCECRTSEILVDPLGFVWRCHFYLYEAWKRREVADEFGRLELLDYRYRENRSRLFDGKPLRPVGHLLDPDFSFADLRTFQPCHHYGRCIGCDTKVKNNRFQSLEDMGQPHTSVEIRNIEMPEEVLLRLDEKERTWINNLIGNDDVQTGPRNPASTGIDPQNRL